MHIIAERDNEHWALKNFKSHDIELAGKKFYMDGYLQYTLAHFVKSVKWDWDFVLLITGIEGVGKSRGARPIAWYLTKTYHESIPFTVDNIVFTTKQFEDAVDNLPKGSAIIWDEFILGGYSEDMSAVQTALIKKFTMIRKKNLFILLVIPFVWLLRSYFAIARTKILIDFTTPDFIKRGGYNVYGYATKQKLYFDGLQQATKWQYRIQADFNGKFEADIAVPDFFVDDTAYEKKKDDATASLDLEGGGTKEEEKEVYVKCKRCQGKKVKRDFDTEMFRCTECGYAVKFEDYALKKGKVKRVEFEDITA